MILSTQRIPGGDLVENGCFIELKLANVCGFSIIKRQLSKKISRCAGNLFIVILSTQRIPGGDLVENGSFIEVKVANVSRFSDSDGTIVWYTVKFKEIESL